MEENKTLAKLKKLVSGDDGKRRRFQRYTFRTAQFTNCLFHAIFNATNKQIKALHLDEEDKAFLKEFYQGEKSTAQALCDIASFVEAVGLRFEPCAYDEILDNQSGKVAIYFSNNLMSKDFHFFREEVSPTGKQVWTSKAGFSAKVEKVDYLDIHMGDLLYAGCFKVSNPKFESLSPKEK